MASPKDNATKLLIANVAEKLFAERGYHATTVRDIFKIAKVNQGLMAYYFKSKEELYSFVIRRRIPELKKKFVSNFPRLKDDKENISPKDIIVYYIDFFVDNIYEDKENLSSYMRILANSSLDFDNDFVRNEIFELHFLIEKMVKALTECAPFISEIWARQTMYYLETSITTMILRNGLREHRLGALYDGDIRRLKADMANFYARGFLH